MEKIAIRHSDYDTVIKGISSWKITSAQKKSVLKFGSDYEEGKITGRVGTNSKGNIARYLRSLKISLENVKSEDKKGIEAFVGALIKNKVFAKGKQPYSVRSKQAILDIYGKYLKWKYPSKNLESLTKIRIEEKKKDPPYLRLEEVTKLYDGCSTDEKRYFIAMLFGTGARAEEFHNIRYRDVELPKGEQTYLKVTLKGEFSKTKGRTVRVYWDYGIDGIRNYIKYREAQGIGDEEPIFNLSYLGQRKWLKRLGERVLKKSINYHLFRHSCASWLASKMNRQQLCIYFGWDFSSPMPDKYISREGLDMEEITERFEKTNFEALKEAMEKQKRESEAKNEEYKERFRILEKAFLQSIEHEKLDLSKEFLKHAAGLQSKQEMLNKLDELSK